MERMQKSIDFIFHNVWCNAPATIYGAHLFSGMPRLKRALEYFWACEQAGTAVKGAEFFLTGLNKIFNEFKSLNPSDIAQLKEWYASNNDIGKCCANTATPPPIRYAQLNQNYEPLTKELYKFFKNLYSQDFLSLKEVEKQIGTISDHYKQFVTVNNESICPFCGIDKLDGQWDSTRDAYDHFLPKSKYPFNSINFKNLIPTCYSCNSKQKGTRNPIYDNGAARKAFYPFSNATYKLNIAINFTPADWNAYTPADIAISFGPAQFSQEINTWLAVYGIDGRYKAVLCEKNFGKYWMTKVHNWVRRGHDLNEFFSNLADDEASFPYAELNFLKKPFLEVCRASGAFNSL